MAAPKVALLMGSDSDLATVKEACSILKHFGVPFTVRVLSAHRCPEELVAFVKQADATSVQVFIAAAGGAAHLGGVVAAHTIKPVIGIPIQTSSLNGLDSLLSIVQMPGGVPVATFAIGKPGAINAALFAAAILATGDAKIKRALDAYRAAQSKKVAAAKLP
jgi:5-(carboxyamino)imidazole ribonucleotide mutase